MAPATAAASSAPFPSESAGAASTTRSQLRALARSVSSLTLSAPPLTTAMRSRRAAEASNTLWRRACCTLKSVLSHTTAVSPSACSSREKAVS